MRSYVSATLLNTPATRCVFSASVTVSKPKCVSRFAVGVPFLEVAPASRVACVVQNGRARDTKDRVGRIYRTEVLRAWRGAAIVTN